MPNDMNISSNSTDNLSSRLTEYHDNLKSGKKTYLIRGKDGAVVRDIQVSQGKSIPERIRNAFNKIAYSFRINVTKDIKSGRVDILDKLRAYKLEINKQIREASQELNEAIDESSPDKIDLTKLNQAKDKITALKEKASEISIKAARIYGHKSDDAKFQEFNRISQELGQIGKIAQIIETETAFGNFSLKQAAKIAEKDPTKAIRDIVKEYQATANRIKDFEETYKNDDEQLASLKKSTGEAYQKHFITQLANISATLRANVDSANEAAEEAIKTFEDSNFTEETLLTSKQQLDILIKAQENINTALSEISTLTKDETKNIINSLQESRDKCRSSLETIKSKIDDLHQKGKEKLEEANLSLRDKEEKLGKLEDDLKGETTRQATNYSDLLDKVKSGESPYDRIELHLQSLVLNLEEEGLPIPQEIKEALSYLKAISILTRAQINQDSSGNERDITTLFDDVANQLNKLGLVDKEGKTITFSRDNFRQGTLQYVEMIRECLKKRIDQITPKLLSSIVQSSQSKQPSKSLSTFQGINYLSLTPQDIKKSYHQTIDQLSKELRQEKSKENERLNEALQKRINDDKTGGLAKKVRAFLDDQSKAIDSVRKTSNKDHFSISARLPDCFKQTDQLIGLLRAMVDNDGIALDIFWEQIFKLRPFLNNNSEAIEKFKQQLPLEAHVKFEDKLRSDKNPSIAKALIYACGGDRKQAAHAILNVYSENPNYLKQSVIPNSSTVTQLVNWSKIDAEKAQIIADRSGSKTFLTEFAKTSDSLLASAVRFDEMGEQELEKFIKDMGWEGKPAISALITGLGITIEEYRKINAPSRELQAIINEINSEYQLLQEDVFNQPENQRSSYLESHPSIQGFNQRFNVKLDLNRDIEEQIQPALQALKNLSKNPREYGKLKTLIDNVRTVYRIKTKHTAAKTQERINSIKQAANLVNKHVQRDSETFAAPIVETDPQKLHIIKNEIETQKAQVNQAREEYSSLQTQLKHLSDLNQHIKQESKTA